MINFSFGLRNPFSRLFNSKVIFLTTLYGTKTLEIEYTRDSEIIGFWFRWTIRESHAGISFGLSLLSFGIYVTLEDMRHWNHTTNTWEEHDKGK